MQLGLTNRVLETIVIFNFNELLNPDKSVAHSESDPDGASPK